MPASRARRGLLTWIGLSVLAGSHTAKSAAAISQGDRSFLAWDIQIEIQQQDMGHLAERRGQSQQVQRLGGYLVDRHRQTQRQLQQLADRLGVTLSTELSPLHRRIQQHYATVPQAEFDTAFVRHEAGDYRYFLRHFSAAVHTGNPLIHGYCTDVIARLKQDQMKIAALLRQEEGPARG